MELFVFLKTFMGEKSVITVVNGEEKGTVDRLNFSHCVLQCWHRRIQWCWRCVLGSLWRRYTSAHFQVKVATMHSEIVAKQLGQTSPPPTPHSWPSHTSNFAQSIYHIALLFLLMWKTVAQFLRKRETYGLICRVPAPILCTFYKENRPFEMWLCCCQGK